MTTSDPIVASAEMRDAAKTFLRLETTADDAFVAALMSTASAHCEAFLGLVLVERSFSQTLDACRDWTALVMTPVASISGVSRVGGGAVAHELDIVPAGDGRVRLTDAAVQRVRVTYRAGLAPTWSGLPEVMRDGVIRVAALLHGTRDTPGASDVSAAFAGLRHHRRMRLS